MKIEYDPTVKKSFGKKPRIEKGYYAGELLEVKPRTDAEGNIKESKFGRQAILLFKVLDKKTLKPVVITNSDGGSEELILATMVYTEYKNDKTGEYRTALTPNSKTTKIFKALGWNGKDDIDTDKLIGNKCELNIDDYDAKIVDENGVETTYKASMIKDINVLEGVQQTIAETKQEGMTEDKVKKLEELKKMLDEGSISKEGFEKVVKDLGL